VRPAAAGCRFFVLSLLEVLPEASFRRRKAAVLGELFPNELLPEASFWRRKAVPQGGTALQSASRQQPFVAEVPENT
jgi:hypothetical protein